MLLTFVLGIVIGCTLATFAITWTLNRFVYGEDVNENKSKS